jgi:hypothetical protein
MPATQFAGIAILHSGGRAALSFMFIDGPGYTHSRRRDRQRDHDLRRGESLEDRCVAV